MTMIANSPFVWLKFDETGALKEPNAPQALLDAMVAAQASDLVVISHGWKTDEAGADALYPPLWTNVCQSLNVRGGPAPEKVVVAGVLWPSKPFQTDFDVAAAQTTNGGTLSVSPPLEDDGDLKPVALEQVVNGYAELVAPEVGAKVAAAVRLTLAQHNSDVGFDPATAEALLSALKSSAGLDEDRLDPEISANAALFDQSATELLVSLSSATNVPLADDAGATLDLGGAVANAIAGPRAAVGRLLNQFTYFAMKKRAGDVGLKLGDPVLSTLRPAQPTRLHLVGHSFGARLVTAAASTFKPSPTLTLWSLTLLQGAYSHNGLSNQLGGGRSGAFASVLTDRKVQGPISMTHTHNDSACTIAYPLASRLSDDTTQGIGDANDPFGAMGANGAQNLDADVCVDQPMAKGQATYDLPSAKVNRVGADACVSEHMDVTNADVGALVASVLRAR